MMPESLIVYFASVFLKLRVRRVRVESSPGSSHYYNLVNSSDIILRVQKALFSVSSFAIARAIPRHLRTGTFRGTSDSDIYSSFRKHCLYKKSSCNSCHVYEYVVVITSTSIVLQIFQKRAGLLTTIYHLTTVLTT